MSHVYGAERPIGYAVPDKLDRVQKCTLTAAVGTYQHVERLKIEPWASHDPFEVPDSDSDNHRFLSEEHAPVRSAELRRDGWILPFFGASSGGPCYAEKSRIVAAPGRVLPRFARFLLDEQIYILFREHAPPPQGRPCVFSVPRLRLLSELSLVYSCEVRSPEIEKKSIHAGYPAIRRATISVMSSDCGAPAVKSATALLTSLRITPAG